MGYHIQENFIGQIKIAGKFDEEWKLGIGTRNDEPILKNIFDKAIQTITPTQHHQILNRWVSVSYEGQSLKWLSGAEKRFLEEHPSIRFRVRPNRPPFEFFEHGKASGIAVDYIRLIGEKLGFTPEFVLNNESPSRALEIIENEKGAFDTLLYAVENSENMKDRLLFGDAYLSYPMMIVTHNNISYLASLQDLKGRRVAVERGFLTNRWLKRDYPDVVIIPARDTYSALQMVDERKVDAYVGNMAVANYMMAYGMMENLRIAAPSEYGNIKYAFVAPKRWPELASLLSKGYRSISQEEHTAIQQRWFSVQIVDQTNYSLIWKVFVGIFLVMLAVLWWNWRLNLKVAEGIKKYKEQESLLIQQSKMAAMGEMIGMIAHQWKQPLNMIALQAQEINDVIEYENSDKNQLQNASRQIFKQIDHMGRTIEDFRMFFKPSMLAETMDACTVVWDVHHLIEAKMRNLQIGFSVKEARCFTVEGPPSEFKQVLLNIYSNACDALAENNPDQPREIVVSCDTEEGWGVIRVYDTGGGIEPNLLPGELFTPYVSTKGDGGTGIGLQMCKMIIEKKFQGVITAANVDRGAEFVLKVPLR